ncbi:transcriptional regulator, LysR family [Shewanella sediminis HAW-EB3]|uniref:Transcriptional regulator, LysR family n=1 Tax=Shewanella sediminis (strain HAW-EB3) TaxID=425104 RepID=A8FSV0_SHESH|nr:LysR family transcriptional regulator [Shewanella sediminis]ABV35923.1 transcriptional regulator, LysR family [Shewanella sediminis HAW-EB3]
MNPSMLRTFVAVYEEGKLTLAAQRCGVTQPTITNVIKMLEQDLGESLFKRGGQGVVPTGVAHSLYFKAKNILSELDLILNTGWDSVETVKVGIPPIMSPHKHQKILRTLNRLSNIGVRIHICHKRQPSDIKIGMDDKRTENELFIPLWNEKFKLCIPFEHPLNQLAEITPSDLDGVEFVVNPRCFNRKRIARVTSGNKRAIKVTAHAHSKPMLIQLVRAGYGAALMSDAMLEGVQDVAIRELSGSEMLIRYGILVVADKAEELPYSQIINAIKTIDFSAL